MAGAAEDSVQLQHATSVHGVALESRRAQRRSSFSSVSSMSSMSSSDFVDALSGEDDDFDEMVHNAPDVHVKDEGGATESCNEEEADEQKHTESQTVSACLKQFWTMPAVHLMTCTRMLRPRALITL